ncbi:hypothetical protein MesoLj131b_32560 [Mesorhizobium sp. 131-2-5]|uniref:phage upper tail fiber protein n=1 Tax=Mesorhizobium sp. 131-2-5 TaxID=2744519 RepID=UPI0019261339|nr:hypothetical protein [Mesorhizobium sp. 131-2-5]BCH01257.1 hypothetical protein MesoLj131b_32560 [Mesorhizobium sp. 131-2-5]
MKTLPIGSNEVVSLPAYNVISITGGAGSIERLGNNPGDPSSGTITTFTADATVGPFPVWTRHMLRCIPSSQVSYDIAPADFPAVDSAFERARVMSQAEYDALTPDPATLYLIVG